MGSPSRLVVLRRSPPSCSPSDTEDAASREGRDKPRRGASTVSKRTRDLYAARFRDLLNTEERLRTGLVVDFFSTYPRPPTATLTRVLATAPMVPAASPKPQDKPIMTDASHSRQDVPATDPPEETPVRRVRDAAVRKSHPLDLSASSEDDDDEMLSGTVASRHTIRFDGALWRIIHKYRSADLQQAFREDTATALQLPARRVTDIAFGAKEFIVYCTIRRSSAVPAAAVTKRLKAYAYPRMWNLYDETKARLEDAQARPTRLPSSVSPSAVLRDQPDRVDASAVRIHTTHQERLVRKGLERYREEERGTVQWDHEPLRRRVASRHSQRRTRDEYTPALYKVASDVKEWGDSAMLARLFGREESDACPVGGEPVDMGVDSASAASSELMEEEEDVEDIVHVVRAAAPVEAAPPISRERGRTTQSHVGPPIGESNTRKRAAHSSQASSTRRGSRAKRSHSRRVDRVSTTPGAPAPPNGHRCRILFENIDPRHTALSNEAEQKKAVAEDCAAALPSSCAVSVEDVHVETNEAMSFAVAIVRLRCEPHMPLNEAQQILAGCPFATIWPLLRRGGNPVGGVRHSQYPSTFTIGTLSSDSGTASSGSQGTDRAPTPTIRASVCPSLFVYPSLSREPSTGSPREGSADAAPVVASVDSTASSAPLVPVKGTVAATTPPTTLKALVAEEVMPPHEAAEQPQVWAMERFFPGKVWEAVFPSNHQVIYDTFLKETAHVLAVEPTRLQLTSAYTSKSPEGSDEPETPWTGLHMEFNVLPSPSATSSVTGIREAFTLVVAAYPYPEMQALAEKLQTPDTTLDQRETTQVAEAPATDAPPTEPPISNPSTPASSVFTTRFPGERWSRILKQNPEVLREAFLHDAAANLQVQEPEIQEARFLYVPTLDGAAEADGGLWVIFTLVPGTTTDGDRLRARVPLLSERGRMRFLWALYDDFGDSLEAPASLTAIPTPLANPRKYMDDGAQSAAAHRRKMTTGPLPFARRANDTSDEHTVDVPCVDYLADDQVTTETPTERVVTEHLATFPGRRWRGIMAAPDTSDQIRRAVLCDLNEGLAPLSSAHVNEPSLRLSIEQESAEATGACSPAAEGLMVRFRVEHPPLLEADAIDRRTRAFSFPRVWELYTAHAEDRSLVALIARPRRRSSSFKHIPSTETRSLSSGEQERLLTPPSTPHVGVPTSLSEPHDVAEVRKAAMSEEVAPPLGPKQLLDVPSEKSVAPRPRHHSVTTTARSPSWLGQSAPFTAFENPNSDTELGQAHAPGVRESLSEDCLYSMHTLFVAGSRWEQVTEADGAALRAALEGDILEAYESAAACKGLQRTVAVLVAPPMASKTGMTVSYALTGRDGAAAGSVDMDKSLDAAPLHRLWQLYERTVAKVHDEDTPAPREATPPQRPPSSRRPTPVVHRNPAVREQRPLRIAFEGEDWGRLVAKDEPEVRVRFEKDVDLAMAQTRDAAQAHARALVSFVEVQPERGLLISYHLVSASGKAGHLGPAKGGSQRGSKSVADVPEAKPLLLMDSLTSADARALEQVVSHGPFTELWALYDAFCADDVVAPSSSVAVARRPPGASSSPVLARAEEAPDDVHAEGDEATADQEEAVSPDEAHASVHRNPQLLHSVTSTEGGQGSSSYAINSPPHALNLTIPGRPSTVRSPSCVLASSRTSSVVEVRSAKDLERTPESPLLHVADALSASPEAEPEDEPRSVAPPRAEPAETTNSRRPSDVSVRQAAVVPEDLLPAPGPQTGLDALQGTELYIKVHSRRPSLASEASSRRPTSSVESQKRKATPRQRPTDRREGGGGDGNPIVVLQVTQSEPEMPVVYAVSDCSASSRSSGSPSSTTTTTTTTTSSCSSHLPSLQAAGAGHVRSSVPAPPCDRPHRRSTGKEKATTGGAPLPSPTFRRPQASQQEANVSVTSSEDAEVVLLRGARYMHAGAVKVPRPFSMTLSSSSLQLPTEVASTPSSAATQTSSLPSTTPSSSCTSSASPSAMLARAAAATVLEELPPLSHRSFVRAVPVTALHQEPQRQRQPEVVGQQQVPWTVRVEERPRPQGISVHVQTVTPPHPSLDTVRIRFPPSPRSTREAETSPHLRAYPIAPPPEQRQSTSSSSSVAVRVLPSPLKAVEAVREKPFHPAVRPLTPVQDDPGHFLIRFKPTPELNTIAARLDAAERLMRERTERFYREAH